MTKPEYKLTKYTPQRLYGLDGKPLAHDGWDTEHRMESGRFVGQYSAIIASGSVPGQMKSVADLRIYRSLRGRAATACFWDHYTGAQGSGKSSHGDIRDACLAAMTNAGARFEVKGYREAWGPMHSFGGDIADLMRLWAEYHDLDAFIHSAHA